MFSFRRRAFEIVLSGLALPFLVYLWLPAYRQFCSEPDPDDLRLIRMRKKERASFKQFQQQQQLQQQDNNAKEMI